MRTLRVVLSGAVTLALLVGLGGGSLAEDEAETAQEVSREAAVFDWTMPYPHKFQEGTREGVPEERMTQVRGEGFEKTWEDVSDPRLAGTWRTIFNQDYYGDAMTGVWTAARRIDNAEGSWLGHFTGYRVPGETGSSPYFQQGVLKGSGAYEGLTALVFMETTEGGQGYDVHGIVFPGELPPFPEFPEPASE